MLAECCRNHSNYKNYFLVFHACAESRRMWCCFKCIQTVSYNRCDHATIAGSGITMLDNDLIFMAADTVRHLMRAGLYIWRWRRSGGGTRWLLCVRMDVRMGMCHWNAVRTVFATFYIQRIVEWEFTAENEFQCHRNLNVYRRWYWYQWRRGFLVFAIFWITETDKSMKIMSKMSMACDGRQWLTCTYCRYFSSDDFSRIGMPDKNSMMSVVNMGEMIPMYSIPSMTLNEMTKMPHQHRISPK